MIVFHWKLSDSKSSQVSMSLLSILIDLNNSVVWMVSIRPPISISSMPLTKSLWKPFQTRTNYNWYDRYFHVPQLFCFLARSNYLTLFSFPNAAKSNIRQILFCLFVCLFGGGVFCFLLLFFFGGGRGLFVLWSFFFFLLIITSSGLLAGIQ